MRPANAKPFAEYTNKTKRAKCKEFTDLIDQKAKDMQTASSAIVFPVFGQTETFSQSASLLLIGLLIQKMPYFGVF